MHEQLTVAKGAVALPKDLLEDLGVHPGEKITVDKLSGGQIEAKALRSIWNFRAFSIA